MVMSNNKYLGTITFFVIALSILILYDPSIISSVIQENFANSSIVSSVNVPNSVIPNTITGTSNDPSVLSSSVSNSSPGYVVTSSNIANTTDITGNSAALSGTDAEGSPIKCDPNTLYSMKNIMRDKNGNIIVRYMDTCGKYYTYQYTQTINKMQDSTSSTDAQPNKNTSTKEESIPESKVNPEKSSSVNIDANTISKMVEGALAKAVSKQGSASEPIIYPS